MTKIEAYHEALKFFQVKDQFDFTMEEVLEVADKLFKFCNIIDGNGLIRNPQPINCEKNPINLGVPLNIKYPGSVSIDLSKIPTGLTISSGPCSTMAMITGEVNCSTTIFDPSKGNWSYTNSSNILN